MAITKIARQNRRKKANDGKETPQIRSSSRLQNIISKSKPKLVQKKLVFEKKTNPNPSRKSTTNASMKNQVPSSDSDDFQSDHGRKNPKNIRRYSKSKIPNPTEKGNSSNSDFEDEIQPEDVTSEEYSREEESPVENFNKRNKKRIQNEKGEVNMNKKRRKPNPGVKRIQKQIVFKEWELLIPYPRDINVKVQNSNDNSKEKCTISDIKKTLTKEQLEAFRMSAFGKFLDLPHCIVQNQLVNYILLREVHQGRTDEIWFDFGGKFLRFGIEEFAVVTGLKCNELSKKLNIPKIANGLHDKYFAGLELTRSHIRWQFLKKLWASDEDAVKFAKLHFLANFLMGSQDALRIDRCFVDMIDSPECDDYSWGTAVFQFTLLYLKKSIQTREQMHMSDNDEGSNLYQLYGLILALQTWFYEVCETADGVVATNMGVHDIPRIIKWEVREPCTRSFVQRTFSNLDHTKFNNIVPPEAEKQNLLLESFFTKRNEFTRKTTPSSSAPQHTNEDYVITRLDNLTAEVQTLKEAFNDFSRRVFEEFALFKEKFLFVPVQNPPYPDLQQPNPHIQPLIPDIHSPNHDIPPLNHDIHLPNPHIHLPSSPIDDDDNFLLINTQFIEEVDKTVQQKLNKVPEVKEPRGFSYEPHPIFGYALNGSQPSFDAIIVVLPPTPPSKKTIPEQANNSVEKNETVKGVNTQLIKQQQQLPLVVYSPKKDEVRRTKKPKKTMATKISTKKQIRLQKSCPFDVGFDINVSGAVDMNEFRDWICEGLLKSAPRKVENGLNYYKVRSKTLPSPFHFNVVSVTDKNWFYHIFEIGCFLDCSHMDVLFYYLRKIGFYAKSSPVRYATTDVLFDQHIKSLYALYVSQSRNKSVCNVDDMIIDYILGYKIICGVSWAKVDHVMFPMHLEINGVGHWILGRLSLADMKLHIYNSIRTVDCDDLVIENVKAYVEILPIFLRLVNLLSTGEADKVTVEVVMVDNLPQQNNRERYAYLLYNHGRMKQMNGYDSDDEYPGSAPDEVRFSLMNVGKTS
ncbi:Domain of unknown function (DUF1985 [Striga hermonthica]|uniref:DUF1985 domain-containing protein n=1 Tax=Striga hermonthica TaxID=68872 RepID=A0A9N7NQS7_STRHE|nr:Domain of unknown function (DUF1985 [Striga hermonthica]